MDEVKRYDFSVYGEEFGGLAWRPFVLATAYDAKVAECDRLKNAVWRYIAAFPHEHALNDMARAALAPATGREG